MSTLFSYYDIIYFDTFNGCNWSISKIKKTVKQNMNDRIIINKTLTYNSRSSLN